MKSAILKVLHDNGFQTFNQLTSGIFNCDVLGRPWKNNEPEISCIPKTTVDRPYLCRWTRSNRLSKVTGRDFWTYEILNVPNRSGIRFHAFNYYFQSAGCYACGRGWGDINKDGIKDLLNSKKTMAEFEALMNKEDFNLFII